MSKWFSYEFQVKHFKYEDCSPERFYASQWGDNVWIFCAYKCFIALYWLGWNIADVVLNSDVSYAYFLTNWGAWTNLLYFLVSSGVCIYGVGSSNSWTRKRRDMFVCTTTVQKYRLPAPSDQPLRWFHILNWILHTVAFDIALAVTVIYWVFPGKPAMESAFSINSHALNFVFMFLDLFIINIPERLLHSVHSFNYTIVYTVFLLILHGSGAESKVYPVTDWARNPGLAAGLCVGAAFATILIRCVAYGLYKLREFIASKTMSTSSVADVVTQTGTFKATSDLGKDNLAYESN